MSTGELGWFGGRDEKAPVDPRYRTCSKCGDDCVPQAMGVDGLGVRFAFACVDHGVQGVIDPFSDSR